MSVQGHVNTIYVTDQERAKRFYTGTLGYTLDRDQMLTETFRWISIIPPGKPEQMIALFACDDSGANVDEQTAAEMGSLVERGAFSAGVVQVSDCYAFCERLKSESVRFLREPEPKEWGVIEAIILDDSGNRLGVVGPAKT